MARQGGARARVRLLAIGVSAAVQLAVLALLVWSTDGRRSLTQPAPMVVSLRRLDISRMTAPTVPPPLTTRRGKAAALAMPSPNATPPQAASPPAQDPADGSQRAARAALLQSVGESVRCADPDAYDMDAIARERCQRAAAQLARDGPVYAVLPADPVKAAAFERAARANEAWRQYTAGSRNYPGLLTLFGHDAEPCPAEGKCWRRLR